MEEERFSQIERDNYLLLDKMSYIMTHPQLLDEKYIGAPVQFGKSLNKDLRKRGEQRVRGGSAGCECSGRKTVQGEFQKRREGDPGGAREMDGGSYITERERQSLSAGTLVFPLSHDDAVASSCAQPFLLPVYYISHGCCANYCFSLNHHDTNAYIELINLTTRTHCLPLLGAELTRITEENLRILRRIQHSEPVLNHMEWEEKARRDEVYLRNCAEYPLVLPSRQNLPRDSIRHTSSSSQNRSMQRKRVGADNENALETHQGFQPVSAATSDPVLPWPVRQRNGGDDRGTPPQDESKDGMFTHQPDRALLQSRGASREGRMEPAMPSLDENYVGDEFEKVGG